MTKDNLESQPNPLEAVSAGKNRFSRRRFLRGAATLGLTKFLLPLAGAVAAPFVPRDFGEKVGTTQASSQESLGFAIADGWFFTTNNEGEGFAVTGKVWEAFQKNGGADRWGPAISSTGVDSNGHTVQFFNRGSFQVSPNGKVEWMNIYDDINGKINKGLLPNLNKEPEFIPPFRDWSSDDDREWGRTSAGPIAGTVEDNHSKSIFGETDQKYPQLKEAYYDNPLWFNQYGLPMGWTDYGNLVVVVCQRTCLQLWIDKTPWTDFPGQVVPSNAGLVYKKLNLIPADMLKPQKPGEVIPSTVITPEPVKVEQTRSPEILGEFKNRVGWAYNAKPEISFEQMLADMKRMRQEGANVVYIGHINPNKVESMPPEPGLGFAVYYARKTGYRKDAQVNAENMFQGVMRALEAAKQNGLDVVLPVGYQIEMGEQWIRENQSHLRRNPDGTIMNHWGEKDSGPTSTPYSPKYREDITEYYKWLQANVISKYPNIKALNLADEPMGGDFSVWAKQEFQRRYDANFDSADPKQQGEFQSGVLADYASWSATLWKEINPSLKTMMTFHIQREVPYFPNFEKIFQQTPDTFVFSADTHMHDAPPDGGISATEVNLLYGMVRHLSWLSNVYNKGLMFWIAANAWGLSNPNNTIAGGGINEARENVRIVTDIAKQDGAKIAMTMAWGYNMGDQGLFEGNKGARPYNPDDMFNQISKDMAIRRDTLSEQMSGSPDTVIYIPSDALYRRIARENVSHVIDRLNPWIDLNRYNFRWENAVYLTDGPALERAKREGSRIIQASI